MAMFPRGSGLNRRARFRQQLSQAGPGARTYTYGNETRVIRAPTPRRAPARTHAPYPVDQPNPVQANFQMPAAQPYQPQTYSDPNLDILANKGAELLDPNSEYYQAMLNRMQTDIGKAGEAGQRAAKLRGAWSGFGAGASPEMMQTAADIGQSSLEAQGEAATGLVTAAPQLGAQMMGQTFAPRQNQFGLSQADRQYGAGLGEQQRQFGANVGLQQQQMANQMAMFNAQQQAQQQQWGDEFNLRQDELAYRYGGLPQAGYGGAPWGNGLG